MNPTYCRFADSDFLETWETIERTTIFDASWVMSSHWLCVPPKPLVHAWSYGEAVCKLLYVVPSRVYHINNLHVSLVLVYFSLSKASTAVIVLSLLDDRYFRGLQGIIYHNVEFSVYKRDTREWKGGSVSPQSWRRSVSCQLELEAGDYAVYVGNFPNLWSEI